jgi:uncharacterized surface protein with fasciclin (FAS1) repeats
MNDVKFQSLNKHLSIGYLILLLVSISINSCNDNPMPVAPEGETVFDYLKSSENYTIFTALVGGTSIEDLLSGNSPYTLFAPTDEAFEKLPAGMREGWTAEQARAIGRYHIMQGLIQFNGGEENKQGSSVHGDPLFFTTENGHGTINQSASMISVDRQFKNGMIYQLDEVLMPDLFGTVGRNIRKRYMLNGLYQQLDILGVSNTLDDEDYITFLLPPLTIYDDIENWLEYPVGDEELADIWKYNMFRYDITGISPGNKMAMKSIQGDSVYVSRDSSGEIRFNQYITSHPSASVIRSSNGAIYTIDGMAVPDRYLGVLTVMDKRDYLNTVRVAFAKAKMTGRLYNVLSNADEEFTVFIPFNQAAGVHDLPEDEDELAEILQYHVVTEKLFSNQLEHNQSFTTWMGEDITISRDGERIYINDTASIILSDLTGKNGVVHVIDSVLQPLKIKL